MGLMNEILRTRAGVSSALENAKKALEGIGKREIEAELELQRLTSECKSIEKSIDNASSRILAKKAELYDKPFQR